MNATPRYEVIVVGGGHAGTEAAWAAASALGAGGRVALVTMDPSAIGRMSCNPAIGGLGKGQIAREIDALGGMMGRAIDAAGIMFKMLNTSKGPAVRGPRAQADKESYAVEVQRLLAGRGDAIDVYAGRVDAILVDGRVATGVRLAPGAGRVARCDAAFDAAHDAAAAPRPIYSGAPAQPVAEPLALRAGAVVLTTGTFMRGLMHVGAERREGGRVGEGAATGISAALAELGFELGRLKTGTPPRLARESIDWEALESQAGDADPRPFSDLSPEALPGGRFPRLPQVECRITATTPEAHALIRANLHRAPMYAGAMEAECGPRYCPSIEDKVVRFADRPSHHVFLEPETLRTNEIYCNGISTSLPGEIQERIVRLMPGCAAARILRYGYAVEYDLVWPHQIDATGMTKRLPGLFLAGQINCTTGYEEAGAQGLVAGLNAARHVRGAEPLRFDRSQAYIGVMMDDLVTKPPREPYRMFTSRAEHRLLLRADNADERLTELGAELGLVSAPRLATCRRRAAARAEIRAAIAGRVVAGRPLEVHARRPETTIAELRAWIDGAAGGDDRDLERVLNDLRYAHLVVRQQAEIRRQRETERRTLPAWLAYDRVVGLRSEARETLLRFRPATMGQASRLPGVHPADLSLLAVAIRQGVGRPAS